jgi:hypothetical protein
MLPFDALSSAASVIQFVDFSIILLSKTKEIRRHGASTEFSGLSMVNRDLTTLAEKLRTGLPHGVLTEDEQALRVICNGCLQVSEQFQVALKKLGIHQNAGKWKSFRKALKVVWGREKLNELRRRLDDYSHQLNRRVLVALR